jgi:hypothetical protein
MRQLFPGRRASDAYELTGAAFDELSATRRLNFDHVAGLDNVVALDVVRVESNPPPLQLRQPRAREPAGPTSVRIEG